MSTLCTDPIWPLIKPFAHLGGVGNRPNLDFLHLPPGLRLQAMAVTTNCVACGADVHPLRARVKSNRSRIAGTSIEERLFYSPTCAQDVNAGCARTREAKDHVKEIRKLFGVAPKQGVLRPVAKEIQQALVEIAGLLNTTGHAPSDELWRLCEWLETFKR